MSSRLRLVVALVLLVGALLAAQPAAAWNATITMDSACGGAHGKLQTGAQYVTSPVKVGTRSLDTAGTGLVVPNRPTINLTREWTISLWVNWKNYQAATTYVFVDRAVGATNNPYMVNWPGAGTSFTTWVYEATGGSGTQRRADGPTTVVTSNTWYHVLATYSATQLTTYVNNAAGTPVAIANGIIVNNGDMYLSRNPTGGQSFNGYIDDYRAYDRVLTAQERTDLFNGAANAGLASGLRIHWKFDETAADADPCAPPPCPTVGWTATSTTIALSWPDVPFERSYKVYRGDPPTTLVATLVANSVGWTDTGRNPATTYKYRVTGANDTAESTGCDVVTATTTLPAPLPAPTGLAATASTTAVDLTWTGVAGASSYKIYRSADAGANYVYLASDSVSPYSDAAIDNGQTYFYKLTTVDAYGQESAYSSEVSATVPYPALLAAPAGFSLSTTANRVTASWSSVSGASAYNLYRSTNGGSTYVLLASLTATAYNDNAVQPATTYWYKVAAVDRWNREGAFTSPQSATPPLPNLLPAPTGLVVTAASTHATVSWEPVAGALLYNVHRSADDGATYAIVSVTNLTTIEDRNVAVAATYRYKVAAVDEYDREGAHSVVALTTIPPPPPLDPPRLTLTSESRAVDVSWPVVAGAHGYRLYRGPDGTDVTLLTTIASGDTTSYRDTSVALGNDYYYRVSVLDAYGQEGPKSDPVGITASVAQNLQSFEPGPGSDFVLIMDLSTATAPAQRWAIVRGDLDIEELRADATGDGTYEHRQLGHDAQFLLAWPTPGTYRIQIAAYNATGKVTHKEYPIKIQVAHWDPSTTPCAGRLCGPATPSGGGIAERIASIDPYFTPADLWAWVLFLASAALMITIAWFKLTRG